MASRARLYLCNLCKSSSETPPFRSLHFTSANRSHCRTSLSDRRQAKRTVSVQPQPTRAGCSYCPKVKRPVAQGCRRYFSLFAIKVLVLKQALTPPATAPPPERVYTCFTSPTVVAQPKIVRLSAFVLKTTSWCAKFPSLAILEFLYAILRLPSFAIASEDEWNYGNEWPPSKRCWAWIQSGTHHR